MSEPSPQNMQANPEPHEVVWDKEKIARYWDVFGNIKPVSPWFSVKASGWLLKIIKNIIKQAPHQSAQTKILDMGSGSGEFINFLREKTGCECYGVDLSDERVAIASQQFPQVNFSVGSLTETGLQDDQFDIIVSTQTIEHLLDDDLSDAFAEMQRVLKPGGALLLTTRFEEDLNIGRKVCPDCHAVFLHSQHVQSFSVDSLGALIEKHGMHVIEAGRSRCRDNVHEFVPRRFRLSNKFLYWLFGFG